MKALILSCGGSPKPLKDCINEFDADLVYFLHSDDSKEITCEIINDTNLSKDQYKLKHVTNHESLDESFAKSREIIKELQKDYDEILVDFTGGTKPMVAGLVLAAIGENCQYSYVGGKGIDSRDKNGLGIVKDGFEEIKQQKDPYDLFAVMEFEKGMDFFNRYQFGAAKINFQEATKKLESKNLKALASLYLQLVDLYDLWDKFNNKTEKNHTLNSILSQIYDKINSSENLKNYLNEEYPDFIPQIQNNIEFLKLKISRRGKIKPEDVKYYLPDLLNNAKRRIEEGKYDDAVARLYRAIELIAQTSLVEQDLIDVNTLNSHAMFQIDNRKLNKTYNFKLQQLLLSWPEYNQSKKSLKITLQKSYKLLNVLGIDFAKDYLNDDDLSNKIGLRNRSILAHGLTAISEDDANDLYEKVLNYSKEVFPEVIKYMEMAEFPKFR